MKGLATQRVRRLWVAALALLLLLLGVRPARAHKPSDAYLRLTRDGTRVDVRMDVALRDLDVVVPLDEDGDGNVTWGEVHAAAAEIQSHLARHFALSNGDQPCSLQATEDVAVVEHTDGHHAVVRYAAHCDSALSPLDARYTLLFEQDPQHRGLARYQAAPDAPVETFTFTAAATKHHLGGEGSGGASFFDALREGVAHIAEGIDHLLFLLALLLPAVVRRVRGAAGSPSWRPVDRLRDALAEVARVVTAFTVAHSITLGVAAAGLVTLPSRLVESAIAASVVIAALANLIPGARVARWWVAFLLGLVHGFGFSAVLADLGLRGWAFARVLLGFNLGVELGQLVAVAFFLPLAFVARRTRLYPRLVLGGGSVAIAAVATVWLVQRALG